MLARRSFRVRIHDCLFLPFLTSSGVPQGSVLGPLLFLLFVNDLPDLLEGKILLFADDVKIISPRSQYDNTELSLRTAWDWSVKLDLPLNPDKCCHVPIGQPPIAPLTFADGKSVEMVESAKDLGVSIDSSFKPSLQCKEAFARARATFYMIRRGFAILTPAIFRPLYMAMVRPHLYYAVQASFPYLQKDIKLIERMQRLATRCVKSFRRLPYPERLQELKLPSMERHFLRATLITVYKLFHGYLNLSAEEFFESPAAGNL